MNNRVKWVANIYQKYTVVDKAVEVEILGASTGVRAVRTTQIISLFVIAGNAQEAVSKADEWLKASKIEDAYVRDVYRADILEIGLQSDEVDSRPDRAVDIE